MANRKGSPASPAAGPSLLPRAPRAARPRGASRDAQDARVQASPADAATEAADRRRVILDAARALLDESGLAAFSLRAVARRAGLSPQAPARCFADGDAILVALVVEGYEALAGRLARAEALADEQGPRAAVLASAQAYVGFALAHPGVFRAMFREPGPALQSPLAQQAGLRARAELDRLMTRVHGAPADPLLASLYWAHVHGLATLFDGPLGQQLKTPASRLAHLRAVNERFVELVFRPRASRPPG